MWNFLSLSSLLAFLSCYCAASDLNRLVVSPGEIVRVRPAIDGSLLVLTKGMNEIFRYSPDGGLLERYMVQSPEGSVREVLDFALDQEGSIHALAFMTSAPLFQIAVVTSPRDHPAYTAVHFKPPIQGWCLEMDRSGNYFVLGVDSELEKSTARALRDGKQPDPVSMPVVHKFSPSGILLLSSASIPVPGAFEDYRREVLNPLFQAESFVVLPDGQSFFLRTIVDSRKSFSDFDRVLYRIDPEGMSERLVPSPPRSGLTLRGIHHADGQLVFEWLDFRTMETILSGPDNSPLLESHALGFVMAITDKKVFSRQRTGSTSSLFQTHMGIER